MPVDFLQPVLADAIVYFQKRNLKPHKKRVDLPALPGPKSGPEAPELPSLESFPLFQRNLVQMEF
jgi:hypothetical protein